MPGKIKLVSDGSREWEKKNQAERETAQPVENKNRIKLVSDGTRDWTGGTRKNPVVTQQQKQEAENLYQRFVREAREKKPNGGMGESLVKGDFTGNRVTAQEKPDWGKITGGAVLQGMDQFAQGASATLAAAEGLVSKPLGYVLGNNELYKDGLFYNWNEKIKEEQQQAADYFAPEYEKAGKVGEIIQKFGPSTVAAIPQAAMAFFTAGQSLAAQGTTAALQGASAAAQGAGIAQTASAALQQAAKNPQFWTSFMTTAGNEYEQAKADGADDLRAYAYGTITGLLNSMVEIGGGIDTLPDGSKKAVREWVESMLDEGKEEVIQGAISQLSQAAVYGKQNPLYSTTDENAVINPKRALEEFAGGAVVGGILGGGQIGVQRALNALGEAGVRARAKTQGKAQEQGTNQESGAGLVLTMPEDLAQPGDWQMRETGADNTTKPTEGTGSRQSAPASQNSVPQSNTESNRSIPYEGRDDTGLTLTMPEELRQDTDWIVQQEKQRGSNAEELTQQQGQNQVENRDSSGFVNMSRRELSDSDSAYLNTLAKAAGVTVRMVDKEGTPQQGWYENGQIFIRSDTADPVREVVKHEITHLMQEQAPEAYQEYLDAVREIYQERGTLDSAIAELRELYRSNHVNLTEEQTMDELAADFAGELTENEAVIQKLAGEKPRLGRRILDTIRQLLEKIRNAVGRRAEDPETQRLERAVRLWETALEAVGTRENQGGELRQSQEHDMMAQTDTQNGEETSYEREGADQQPRAESREDFIRRSNAEGYTVVEGKSGSFGYRPIRVGIEGHSGKIQKELRSLGVKSAITEGPVQWNMNGITGTREIREATTVDGEIILISSNVDMPVKQVAGHEAFHFWKESPARDKYIDTVQENLIFTSPDFQQYQTALANDYFGGDVDLDDSAKNKKFMEELFAYLSGDIHEGAYDKYLRPMFRDYDAVKAAWENLVSEMSGESGTRYSMEGSRDLLQQIEILQKQNQRLKEEMKRTNVPRMNRGAVEKQAGELLEAYSSRYNKSKLSDQLETLYNGIADRSMLESDMRETAREIADSIIQESRTQVNPLYEEYADLRKTLRETKLYLQEEYRGDIRGLGYEDLRKKNMGRLRLANEGTAVESLYDSLSEKHPDLFPDDIYHPAEQLERIVDVAGQLQKVMDNPYEGTKAAEYLANDILERYYDTETRKPTFADRQYAKRQQEKAALKGKYQGKAAQARERAKLQEQMYYSRILHEKQQKQTQQIKEIRQRYRDANRAMSERRTETQLRDTIARHANKLAGKLLRPNDKQHIPEHLRGSVLDLLRSIDIGSNYTVNMATGERIRLDNMAEFQQLGLSTKRSEAALRLKESYAKLESDEGASMVIDPDLLDTLTEVALLGETRLADMNRKQLTTLWNAVKAVETSIQTADKMLTESRYQTVSEAANALEEENWEKQRKPRFIGLRQLDNLLNLDMLTPETFFHKLGKPGEEMYRQLRQAKDRETEILSEMVDKSQKIFRDSGLDPYQLEKEVKEFTLSTKDKNGKPEKITMTTAQIMELYNLSRRKQAVKHLYEGGIRPSTVQKGVREIWRPAAVNITPDDMGKIIRTLTPEQKALADSMRKELSTTVAGYGNEASMAAYGYEKFKEKDYWPIKVDKGSTKTDPAAEAKSKTIPGYGMTKATVPKANNPVGIHSVFDTYSQHISQMATYAAWLTASQDVQRIHNFKFEAGGGTVKNIFDQVYGEGGNRYIEKLMQDIAAGTKAVGDTEFSMDAAISNFKASAVGWNMRVVLQQPTAILRAAEMIDMKYLAAGMAKKGGWEKALQYAPIAKWKDWGYFEIGTGKSLKELMLGPGSRMEKLRGKSMELAGKMDSVAWGALWNAVELEIQDKKPELRKGSQEYYKECADRFSEIIDRTQVVDSVLHRTQAMRSQNHLYKMATSFMSEPSKVYNQVARGVYDLTSAGTKEERATAGKKLAGTALALTLSFAANAVSQSLSDTWRDDDEEKELDEKFSEHWKENFLQNYNPIGYVPFLKDIASIWEGYDVSRMDMEAVSSLVDAAKNLQRSMDGTGKNTKGYAGFEMALEACRALGLPVANIKRDALGIVSTALNEMGLYKEAYEMDKLMYSIDNGANRSVFVGDLYHAMDENREDYEAIYQDLLQEGMEAEEIKSSMESRMKKELGVESVKSLPMRYHAPGEDEEFDNFMLEAAESGKDWTDLLPDGSREMAQLLEENKDVGKLERIDAIATSPWDETIKEIAMENQMGESDYQKYMAARETGVSTLQYADFLQDAYLNAQKRTGKDDASPSQEDVKNALNDTKLSRSQKRAIWNSYGWKTDSPW